MENKILNELKVLALEAISNSGSGHSGSVLSCTDVLFTLYTKHLVRGVEDSPLRDRFVLSNGHACAGLYAILAGMGYFDIAELSKFRKFGGMLTGHPEINIPGIDCATGPLGQGVGNAVGLAIAESIMNARFEAGHHTYCMCGDGCLEEGVALEALSIAGLYRLNKFILLYDKNDVTLDGTLDKSSTDNIKLKFESMGFNVLECDGHNLKKIDKAITKAKQSKDKPTAIIFHTIIGKDSTLAGSNKSHGKVFSKDEIEEIKKTLNVEKPYLDLREHTKEYLKRMSKEREIVLKLREQLFNEHLEEANLKKEYQNFSKINVNFKTLAKKLEKEHKDSKLSTRDANEIVLNEISSYAENLLTLSADLSSSTKVKINNVNASARLPRCARNDNTAEQYTATNRLGKNIAVGIREHAMGAIAVGIALHGEFRVITSTFLTFSNYMLPPIRMAAIMNLPVLFCFSHASVFDTTDGVTHIPVEQLDQLRLIPNVAVFRPASLGENLACYQNIMSMTSPACLVLSRSNLNPIEYNENATRGAYKLGEEKAVVSIMSSGSEVQIALEVKDLLKDKCKINVISVPSIEVFEKQDKKYIKETLKGTIFVVESGTCAKYFKYAPAENIFNVTEFGLTGDETSLKNHFGYAAKSIANKILKQSKK